MRRFDKNVDILDKNAFDEYETAFNVVCKRCMGEEGDCITCPAHISYYTLRSENKV